MQHCIHCQEAFPCGVCNEPAVWTGKSLQCDECDKWVHQTCAQMSDSTYEALNENSNMWFCPHCGVTNNTELINSYTIPVSNTYNTLNHNVSLEDYTDLDSTVGSNTILLQPREHSTPEARRPTHTAPKPRRTVKVINVNCRSISKNRDRLAVLTDTLKPDIIICTETHMSKNDTVPPVLDEYDVEHRPREPADGGGGVLIAARKEYLMTRDYDLEPTNTELMWCKINIQGTKTLHIGAFYRPDISDDSSLGELDASLSKIPKSHAILLGGDFNLPNFTWKDGNGILKPGPYPSHHEDLTDIMHDHGLTQHISEYTRKDPVHGTENTLDLIFTNRPYAVISSSVAPGISDHDVPQIEFDIKPVRVIKKPRDIPLYRKAKWDEFHKHAEKVCSEVLNLPEETDANQLWNHLKEGLNEGIKQFIPTRHQKLQQDLPFITPEIKTLIRRRDRLYDRMKKARKSVNTHMKAARLENKYKKLKQEVQKKIRSSYWSYIEDVICPEADRESGAPSKSFWSMIKRMRTDNIGISALKDPQTGQLTTDAVGKANALNAQFESVFTKETPLTPEHDKSQEVPDIPVLEFTTKGVEKLLTSLDPSKACGPDNLSPRVLKELAPDIAPAVTRIFNVSYSTGKVPDDWRHANVVPAYKKGKKTLPVNYRPISLTCVLCKLFEHCVTKHIMQHCEKHNILYPLQHGFRSQLSCETQLVEFIHDITTNSKNGHQTDVLVMDFSKAFDKVGHKRLMKKLSQYGINGPTATWITNYLAGRTQTVVLDGETSSTAPVTSGVPQGSVLGPCLFLLYINDLAESLESTVRLFADDTIAYLAIKNPGDASALQRDLDKLAAWEEKWQMEFHPDKCEVLRINKKHKENTINASYNLRGHTLKVVSEAKYLGVTISGDLRWNTHITKITNKANSTLGALRRNVRVSSKKIKETAYKTLVRPQLEYCSPLWDPATGVMKNKLEQVQRRSVRWVYNKYQYGPRHPNAKTPTEMMRELEWVSLETRRRWAKLVLVYKMLNNLVNMSYRSLLIPYPYHTANMPLGSITPLHIPAAPNYYNNSFFPSAVEEWNCMLRLQPSLVTTAGPDAKLAVQAFKASVMAVVA